MFLLPKSFNCVTYGSLDFPLCFNVCKIIKISVIELKVLIYLLQRVGKGYASSHQIKNKNDNYEQRVNASFQESIVLTLFF